MHHFPYDVQECKVKLGSWTYDGSVVIILYTDENVDLMFVGTWVHHDIETFMHLCERNSDHLIRKDNKTVKQTDWQVSMDSPHKGLVILKAFPCHDVIICLPGWFDHAQLCSANAQFQP